MEGIKEGFKRLLNTPLETHKEVVERRRGGSKPSAGKRTTKA